MQLINDKLREACTYHIHHLSRHASQVQWHKLLVHCTATYHPDKHTTTAHTNLDPHRCHHSGIGLSCCHMVFYTCNHCLDHIQVCSSSFCCPPAARRMMCAHHTHCMGQQCTQSFQCRGSVYRSHYPYTGCWSHTR